MLACVAVSTEPSRPWPAWASRSSRVARMAGFPLAALSGEVLAAGTSIDASALTANLGSVIVAIGALGTASFGLVDVLKTLPNGGISHAGWSFIETAVGSLFAGQRRAGASGDVQRLFDTLHGNWINGTALADQKAIAKSLIKLRLNDATAAGFAAATGVDADVLKSVATRMATGQALDPDEMNVLGRFDLALTAILDSGYQHADQCYRNWSKLAAMVISTLLALTGGFAVSTQAHLDYLFSAEMWMAVLAGLLATPIAPVSKDLSSGLAAGIKVAQALRR